MGTPFYNWPEIPDGSAPNVPYHVTAALREADETVHALEMNAVPRIAKLEAEAGFDSGSSLQFEDDILAGLLGTPTSQAAREMAKTYVDKASTGSAAFPAWSGISRVYLSSNTPADGNQPGDLVLKISDPPKGPGGIPGCVAWYDVSTSAVSDNNVIGGLTDLSGYGRDLSAPAGMEPVMKRATGKPRLNLADDTKARILVGNSGTTLATGVFSVFLVMSATTRAATPIPAIFSSKSGITGSTILWNAGKYGTQGGSMSNYEDGAGTPLSTTPHSFLAEWDYPNNVQRLYIDGVLVATETGAMVAQPLLKDWIVGARDATGAQPANSTFWMGAAYNRLLSSQERADLFTIGAAAV